MAGRRRKSTEASRIGHQIRSLQRAENRNEAWMAYIEGEELPFSNTEGYQPPSRETVEGRLHQIEDGDWPLDEL